MMPLSMANVGETVTIQRISGKDSVRQHLAELGFVADNRVTVVNQIGGNLILQVKDSRVALDRTMANRIMVQDGSQTETMGKRVGFGAVAAHNSF